MPSGLGLPVRDPRERVRIQGVEPLEDRLSHGIGQRGVQRQDGDQDIVRGRRGGRVHRRGW
jgi:hypothetical protein